MKNYIIQLLITRPRKEDNFVSFYQTQTQGIADYLIKNQLSSEESKQLITQSIANVKRIYFPDKVLPIVKPTSISEKIQQAYQDLLPILKLVHLEEKNGQPDEMAWKLAVTFGTAFDALNYISQCLKALNANQVVHDACLYGLPERAIDKTQIGDWQGLVKWQQLAKKHMMESEFRRLFVFANEIELMIIDDAQQAHQQAKLTDPQAKYGAKKDDQSKQINLVKAKLTELNKNYKRIKNQRVAPERYGYCTAEDDNQYQSFSEDLNRLQLELVTAFSGMTFREADLAIIKAYSAKYRNSEDHIYRFFTKNGLTKSHYEKFLRLQSCDNDERIPAITIDGNLHDAQGYYLRRLSVENIEDAAIAACLGKLTDCCQSLSGEAGEPCAIHGLTSPEGGFYVIFKGDLNQPTFQDKVIAQSWVWRSQTNALVIDSIESEYESSEKHKSIIKALYHQLCFQLLTGEYGIELITHGEYSGISDVIKLSLQHMYEEPIDYDGYRDSQSQLILATSSSAYYRLKDDTQTFLDKYTDPVSEEMIAFLQYSLENDIQSYIEAFTDKHREKGHEIIRQIQKFSDESNDIPKENWMQYFRTIPVENVYLFKLKIMDKYLGYQFISSPDDLRLYLQFLSEIYQSSGQYQLQDECVNLLFYAIVHPRSFGIILELIPKHKRLDVVKGVILNSAIYYNESLEYIFYLVPETDELLSIILQPSDHQDALIFRALHQPDSFDFLFSKLEKSDKRHYFLQHKDRKGTTVLQSILMLSSDNFSKLSRVYSNEELRTFLLEKNPFNGSVLSYALNNPACFKKLLAIFTKEQQFQLLAQKDDNNATLLHLSALIDSTGLCLEALLNLYPSNERVTAINQTANQGHSVFDCALGNVDCLKKLLSLITQQEAENLIRQHIQNGKKILEFNTSNCMPVLISIFPEEERVEIARQNGWFERENLLKSLDNPNILNMLLKLLPRDECLELIYFESDSEQRLIYYANSVDAIIILLKIYSIEEQLKFIESISTSNHQHSQHLIFALLSLIPRTDRIWALHKLSHTVRLDIDEVFRYRECLTLFSKKDRHAVLSQLELIDDRASKEYRMEFSGLMDIMPLYTLDERIVFLRKSMEKGVEIPTVDLLKKVLQLLPHKERFNFLKDCYESKGKVKIYYYLYAPKIDWRIPKISNYHELNSILGLFKTCDRVSFVKLCKLNDSTDDLTSDILISILKKLPNKDRLKFILEQPSMLSFFHSLAENAEKNIIEIVTILPKDNRAELISLMEKYNVALLNRIWANPQIVKDMFSLIHQHQRKAVLLQKGVGNLSFLTKFLQTPETLNVVLNSLPNSNVTLAVLNSKGLVDRTILENMWCSRENLAVLEQHLPVATICGLAFTKALVAKLDKLEARNNEYYYFGFFRYTGAFSRSAKINAIENFLLGKELSNKDWQALMQGETGKIFAQYSQKVNQVKDKFYPCVEDSARPMSLNCI